MSEESNKATVSRWYEAFNTGDPSAFEGMFAQEFSLHIGATRSTTSRTPAEDNVRLLHGVRAAFPDIRYVVEDLFAAGDRVVARVRATGTHLGDFHLTTGTVLPATGKPVQISEITIHRFEGGKIAEQWWEVDFAGVLHQVSVREGARR